MLGGAEPPSVGFHSGVGVVAGKNTLVAITISSSRPNLRSARPVTSSLTPSEYMSDVSKKLIPSSIARRKNGWDCASSSTQGRHEGEP